MSTSTALLTDHYELTMLQAALRDRHRPPALASSSCSPAGCPTGRRYGVVAGIGRLLDAIEALPVRRRPSSPCSLTRASSTTRRSSASRSYRFTGDIWGYAEGEVYFPDSPLLVVEGSFAEAVLLETVLLSIFNHDTAVASAASRMTCAAGDRPCIEMGSRRTHEEAAVAGARAAYVAGFATTLQPPRPPGVRRPDRRHQRALVHAAARDRGGRVPRPGERARRRHHAAGRHLRHRGGRAASRIEVAGTDLGAVRIDSGDLGVLAHQVRAQLDELGATKTRIVVTCDLDEFAIAALASAPVDGYGVGTPLVTGSGHPTCGFVYKLVAREDSGGEMVGVAKRSKDKISIGGRKYALRRLSPDGIAEAEVIGIGQPAENDGDDRSLLVPLVPDGEVVGRESLDDARARHLRARAELPLVARQLSQGEPAIETVHEGA